MILEFQEVNKLRDKYYQPILQALAEGGANRSYIYQVCEHQYGDLGKAVQ